MAFLNDIDQVRQVEWGRTYLWDILIDDAPNPFDTWFPAVEVEEEIAKLESHTVEAYLSTYKIPLKSAQKHIKITLEDDEESILSQWFSDWINSTIFNNGLYVSVLNNCVKQLHLLKQYSTRETVFQSDYWVYPEGDLVWSGNSQSNSQKFTVNFVIAGTILIGTTLDSA